MAVCKIFDFFGIVRRQGGRRRTIGDILGKLGACAFDFLDVVARGVGQCNRTVRFLLEVFKRNVCKVERNLLHRKDAAAVRTAGLERRDHDVAERNFGIGERIAVTTRFAAAQDSLRNVVALRAG